MDAHGARRTLRTTDGACTLDVISQAPMAMVIMCGLLSSTALNMIVVPILDDRFGRPAAPVVGR
jgi:hypothetical protein